jgi:hypothetical protein
VSTGNWGPPTAITREQHDAIVAARGRPVTADPMREAKPDEDLYDTPSLIDKYISNIKGQL